MTGKDLFIGLSYIHERFIYEAETCELPKYRNLPWMRITAAAACLFLVMLSLWCMQPYHGQTPETTAPSDPFMLEGFPAVIVYAEEMTEDGFIGTVVELVGPWNFEIGMELKVVIPDETPYITTDGESYTIGSDGHDCSGHYLLVECYDYDPDTKVIVALCMAEVLPTEPTP